MIKKWLIIPTLLTVISLIMILSASYVTAQDGTETSPTTTTFLTVDHRVKSDISGEYISIEAKLIGEDGRPVGERSVTFFLIEDYFGLNSIRLGTATTNAVGIASIRYETMRVGAHQIEAIFTGDDEYIAARVISTINITNVPAVEDESIGLQPIHNAGLMVVGIIVLFVWILLVIVLYKLFFGIRQSGDTAT